MLGIEFEDLIEGTLREVNSLLNFDENDKRRKITKIDGEGLLKFMLDIRHRVVHRSENIIINEVDFDNMLLFMSFLAPKIRNVFFNTEVRYIYRKFVFGDENQSEER